MKGVRCFLGHVGFYHRFVKDFSKVVNPLCKLLEKDVKFHFNEDCLKEFELLKFKLTTTPIITAPYWSLPFELMCDASDVVVKEVFGQRINKIFHLVYYASKTMNDAQVNYTVTVKELFAIVLAIEKFCPYLMGTKVIVHIDHAMLRYLMSKNDLEARCVPEEEQVEILEACHSSPYGGRHDSARMTEKVLSCGFYWPTLYKDASDLVKRCDECQRAGGISKKNEMPLITILEMDFFDEWGIDFMGLYQMALNNEALRNLPLGEEVDDDHVDEIQPKAQEQRRGRAPNYNIPNPPPPPPRAAHWVLPNEGYAGAIVLPGLGRATFK
uniref:Uncharacterized protein LOC104213730 n=1 Tax=Nicotiana sylvestris TaxID=4096 RepID=A0A1U7V9B0_NICSY|nr:PREDICTED: uncharacterized protein LOC104213730 [Nicotiana sylvestris]